MQTKTKTNLRQQASDTVVCAHQIYIHITFVFDCRALHSILLVANDFVCTFNFRLYVFLYANNGQELIFTNSKTKEVSVFEEQLQI